MDKISKALSNLSNKDRELIKNILLKIKNHSLDGLDIQKLKAYHQIFRVRKGKWRIIFKKELSGQYIILTIEKRRDNTYR